MKVSFKIMTEEQAWQFICGMHRQYHEQLKQFDYTYDMFIPQWPFLVDMFKNSNPTDEEIEQYHTKFMHWYRAEQLHVYDDILETQARPALERVADTLMPFAKKWGVKIPDEITILVTYGNGGSYNPDNNTITLRATRMPTGKVAKVLQHELVHIIIEKAIIRKYNVPQDLKERIVDIICQEYFDKEPQACFINSFANNYINRAVIESDLPGAVQKMMADRDKIKTINGILDQLHDPVRGICGTANDLRAQRLKREEYEVARMAQLDQIVGKYGLEPRANRSRKIFRMTGEDVVKNRFEWSRGHWAKAVCYLNNQLPVDKRLELCVMMSTEIHHLSDGMECHTIPCVRLSDGKWHAFEPRNKSDNAEQIEFLAGEIALGKTVEHLLDPIRGHQYKIVAILSPEDYETKMGDFSYALEVFKGKLLADKMKNATANVAAKDYAECKQTEIKQQNQDSR